MNIYLILTLIFGGCWLIALARIVDINDENVRLKQQVDDYKTILCTLLDIEVPEGDIKINIGGTE